MDCESVVYTVQEGDTMWGIAQRYLGSGKEWRRILSFHNDCFKNDKISQISNPDIIAPGKKIRIPVIPSKSENKTNLSPPPQNLHYNFGMLNNRASNSFFKNRNTPPSPHSTPPTNFAKIGGIKQQVFYTLHINWAHICDWPILMISSFAMQNCPAAKGVNPKTVDLYINDFINAIGKTTYTKSIQMPISTQTPRQVVFSNGNTNFTWNFEGFSFETKFSNNEPELSDIAAYNESIRNTSGDKEASESLANTKIRDTLKEINTTISGRFGSLTISQPGQNPFVKPSSIEYSLPVNDNFNLTAEGISKETMGIGVGYSRNEFNFQSKFFPQGNIDFSGGIVLKRNKYKFLKNDIPINLQATIGSMHFSHDYSITYSLELPKISIGKHIQIGIEADNFIEKDRQFFGINLKYIQN